MDSGATHQHQPNSYEEWARWFYDQGAFGIVPASRTTKKPLVGSWKKWQTERMTEDDLRANLNGHDLDSAPAVIPGGSAIACWDCDCPHATAMMDNLGMFTQTLCERRAETPDRLHVWIQGTSKMRNKAKGCHLCNNDKALDLRCGAEYTIAPGNGRVKVSLSPVSLALMTESDVEKIQRLFTCTTKIAATFLEWEWKHGQGSCHQRSLGLACVLYFAGVERQAAKLIVKMVFNFLGDKDNRETNVETTYTRALNAQTVSREGISDDERNSLRSVLRMTGFSTTEAQRAATVAAPPGGEPPAPTSPTGSGGSRHYARTDSGNAEYLADHISASVRYDHRREQWFIWDRHSWRADDLREIDRLTLRMMRQRFHESESITDLGRRELEATHAVRSESRSRLDATVSIARSDPRIASGGEDWDTDGWLIAATNGVIDLRTGELRAGKPEDRITMRVNAEYHPNALAPRWEQFVKEVFGEDEDLVRFVQRALGYSITGRTDEQVWFLCWGEGSNGKSTLLRAIRHVIADYHYTVPFQTFEMESKNQIPSDVAQMAGKRFITAVETTETAKLNESRIKALTGQDEMSARHLYGKWFHFTPLGKLWLAANHRPTVYDDSHAFWRRVRLIPFLQRFEGEKIDRHLEEKLKAESSGILRWLVDGALAWQRQGLEPPKVVMESTAQYREESDPLADFLTECCALGPQSTASASELHQAYVSWATQRGLSQRERLGSATFGRKLAGKFPRRREARGRIYIGVKLKVQAQLVNDNTTGDGPELSQEERDSLIGHGSTLCGLIRQEWQVGLGAPEEMIRPLAEKNGIGEKRFAFLLQHLSERGRIYSEIGSTDKKTYWKLTDGM